MNPGDDIAQRRSQLSPAKRALVERRLRGMRARQPGAVQIPRLHERRQIPLSFGQQRLWFLDQFEPGNAAYHRPANLRFVGPLNVAALERSLHEIMRRHEVLRTCFPAVGGSPVQCIAPEAAMELPLVDLSNQAQSEAEAAAQELAVEEARRPFDLARGPVMRARLIRLGSDDHVLLLTFHHIVFDGWSEQVLRHELAELYEAFSAGRPSPLAEPTVQYADYAAWQREWMLGDLLEKQLAYWKQQLDGAPQSIDLPSDRPRPARATYRGASRSLLMPAALTEQLQALSRSEGATLFMTLLAAFQTLLARHTGQDDVVIGSPIAGRNQVEIEGLIGFFVNTLVLRTELSGNPTFRELLARVRGVALGAYEHQDLPFEKLVEELQPERNLSHSPLFQILFQLRNIPKKDHGIAGLEVREFEVETGLANFDLSADMTETRHGLLCKLEYNADLFEPDTVTRMLEHWQTLLQGIASDPDRRIAERPLLTEAERHKLLVGWNETALDYPKDTCLQELFEAQVERRPDAVALVFEKEQVTYAKLNARSNQLAHYLRALGVVPETLVAISMERSPEMVVAILGVLKAGAAYVPLDPAYPLDRLSFMIEDTRAPVLLTQQRLCRSLPVSAAHVFCLDSDWEVVTDQSEANLASGATAESLAYVVYTSGSTGKPKGVLAHHRGVVNYVMHLAGVHCLQETDGVLQLASLSFDASVRDMLGPLCFGARVVLVRKDKVRDPLALLDTIRNERVTAVLSIVPSMLRTLLEAGRQGQAACPLRLLLTSGGPSNGYCAGHGRASRA